MTGKMELGDEEERRSFRSKGIPVIFHDELDEKPEIVTKSPIILKDERPPLLPPSYNSTAIDGELEGNYTLDGTEANGFHLFQEIPRTWTSTCPLRIP